MRLLLLFIFIRLGCPAMSQPAYPDVDSICDSDYSGFKGIIIRHAGFLQRERWQLYDSARSCVLAGPVTHGDQVKTGRWSVYRDSRCIEHFRCRDNRMLHYPGVENIFYDSKWGMEGVVVQWPGFLHRERWMLKDSSGTEMWTGPVRRLAGMKTGRWRHYRDGKMVGKLRYNKGHLKNELYTTDGRRKAICFTYGFSGNWFSEEKEEACAVTEAVIGGCIVSRKMNRRAILHNTPINFWKRLCYGKKWTRFY